MSIDSSAPYHKEVNLNDIARFVSAVETIECEQCCFYLPSAVPGEVIPYPVFNGTHLINGTEIFNAIPLGIGVSIFNNSAVEATDAIVLPCPQLYYSHKLYYYYNDSNQLSSNACLISIIIIVLLYMI